jgi:hypothetical protein
VNTCFFKAKTDNDIQLLNQVIEDGTQNILEKGGEIKGGKRYVDYLTLDDQIIDEVNDGVYEACDFFFARCEADYNVIERCLLSSIVNQTLLKHLGCHLGMIK